MQVIAAASLLDARIFERQPELLFELERQACAAHVQAQDFAAGAQHCRQHLTPLTTAHPSFVPALKVLDPEP